MAKGSTIVVQHEGGAEQFGRQSAACTRAADINILTGEDPEVLFVPHDGKGVRRLSYLSQARRAAGMDGRHRDGAK